MMHVAFRAVLKSGHLSLGNLDCWGLSVTLCDYSTESFATSLRPGVEDGMLAATIERSFNRDLPSIGNNMMWILRTVDQNQDKVLRLPPDAVRTIGRGPRADFIIDGNLISRIHCRLSAANAQLVVEDLQSTNGTYVNDERVACVALKDGDKLRMGRVELIVSQG